MRSGTASGCAEPSRDGRDEFLRLFVHKTLELLSVEGFLLDRTFATPISAVRSFSSNCSARA